MIRNADLFSIATSGVNASNKLLQTTSNNIANVNSEGYVRERTTFNSELVGGVGQASTERIINIFAQNQMRRDMTEVGEWEAFQGKTDSLNNLLANEANSLATGLSQFFSSIQTAADDPTNLASRDLVLGQGESLLRRMSSISDFMTDKEEELNLEFTNTVNRANNLIKTIGDLNRSILVVQGNRRGDEPSALLNERDVAINELSKLMSIEVREGANKNGSLVVNLTSGESLVLEDGSFNFFELGSDADLNYKQLQLATNFNGAKANTSLNVTEDKLGGALGGLFRYREEILDPARRDVGQLAVAFADAVNSQNRLGMDLDFQLGDNIFELGSFQGLVYEGTPANLVAAGQFTPGGSSGLTDADIKVTVSAVSGGVPSEITVEMLNGDGSPKLDQDKNPIVYSSVSVGSGLNTIPGGIDVSFDSPSGYAVGDAFLFQPVKTAASSISMATTRPDDLAFASPVRVNISQSNLGDAQVVGTQVTNTQVDATLGNKASAFDGAGGLHDVAGSPSATQGAPVQVVFTSPSSYEVYDGATPPNVITRVSGVTSYENLLSQAATNGSSPAWPSSFAALDDYPGYDFSLQGAPVAGDSFTIGYNTNGINDNSNAVKLAEVQQQKLVQLSTNSNSTPRTLHESYASLVSEVGEQAASADIALRAAETMKEQSTTWFDSVSGVSLDEEAANLVRFQQSYAAAARILSTAQELFDTILSASR